MSAYYLKGVQKTNVELMEIFRGIMPFLGIVIFAASSSTFNENISIILFYWANNVSGNHKAIAGNIYIKNIAKITIPKNGIIPLNISISSTFVFWTPFK